MDISEHKDNQRPWRVLGKTGDAKISVAPPTSVRVEAAGFVAVIPLPLVIALQTQEARDFIADPAVAPFMYAASDRESRIRAAKLLASKGLVKLRRDFVAECVALGVREVEAWELAKIKFPIEI